jgi:hypothetical protein
VRDGKLDKLELLKRLQKDSHQSSNEATSSIIKNVLEERES